MADYDVVQPLVQTGAIYNQGLGDAPQSSLFAAVQGAKEGIAFGIDATNSVLDIQRENDPAKLAADQLQRDLDNKRVERAVRAADQQYAYEETYGGQQRQATLEATQAATAASRATARQSRIRADILEETGVDSARAGIAEKMAKALKSAGLSKDNISANPTSVDAVNPGDLNADPNTITDIRTQTRDAGLDFIQRQALGNAYKTQEVERTKVSSQLTNQHEALSTEQEQLERQSVFNEVANDNKNLGVISAQEQNYVVTTESLYKLGEMQKSAKTPEQEAKVGAALDAIFYQSNGPQAIIDSIAKDPNIQDKEAAAKEITRLAVASGYTQQLANITKDIATAGFSPEYAANPQKTEKDIDTAISGRYGDLEDTAFKSQVRSNDFYIGAQAASKDGTQGFTTKITNPTANPNGVDMLGQQAPSKVIQFIGNDGQVYYEKPITQPLTPADYANWSLVDRAALRFTDQAAIVQNAEGQVQQIQESTAASPNTNIINQIKQVEQDTGMSLNEYRDVTYGDSEARAKSAGLPEQNQGARANAIDANKRQEYKELNKRISDTKKNIDSVDKQEILLRQAVKLLDEKPALKQTLGQSGKFRSLLNEAIGLSPIPITQADADKLESIIKTSEGTTIIGLAGKVSSRLMDKEEEAQRVFATNLSRANTYQQMVGNLQGLERSKSVIRDVSDIQTALMARGVKAPQIEAIVQQYDAGGHMGKNIPNPDFENSDDPIYVENLNYVSGRDFVNGLDFTKAIDKFQDINSSGVRRASTNQGVQEKVLENRRRINEDRVKSGGTPLAPELLSGSTPPSSGGTGSSDRPLAQTNDVANTPAEVASADIAPQNVASDDRALGLQTTTTTTTGTDTAPPEQPNAVQSLIDQQLAPIQEKLNDTRSPIEKTVSNVTGFIEGVKQQRKEDREAIVKQRLNQAEPIRDFVDYIKQVTVASGRDPGVADRFVDDLTSGFAKTALNQTLDSDYLQKIAPFLTDDQATGLRDQIMTELREDYSYENPVTTLATDAGAMAVATYLGGALVRGAGAAVGSGLQLAREVPALKPIIDTLTKAGPVVEKVSEIAGKASTIKPVKVAADSIKDALAATYVSNANSPEGSTGENLILGFGGSLAARSLFGLGSFVATQATGRLTPQADKILGEIFQESGIPPETINAVRQEMIDGFKAQGKDYNPITALLNNPTTKKFVEDLAGTPEGQVVLNLERAGVESGARTSAAAAAERSGISRFGSQQERFTERVGSLEDDLVSRAEQQVGAEIEQGTQAATSRISTSAENIGRQISTDAEERAQTSLTNLYKESGGGEVPDLRAGLPKSGGPGVEGTVPLSQRATNLKTTAGELQKQISGRFQELEKEFPRLQNEEATKEFSDAFMLQFGKNGRSIVGQAEQALVGTEGVTNLAEEVGKNIRPEVRSNLHFLMEMRSAARSNATGITKKQSDEMVASIDDYIETALEGRVGGGDFSPQKFISSVKDVFNTKEVLTRQSTILNKMNRRVENILDPRISKTSSVRELLEGTTEERLKADIGETAYNQLREQAITLDEGTAALAKARSGQTLDTKATGDLGELVKLVGPDKDFANKLITGEPGVVDAVTRTLTTKADKDMLQKGVLNSIKERLDGDILSKIKEAPSVREGLGYSEKEWANISKLMPEGQMELFDKFFNKSVNLKKLADLYNIPLKKYNDSDFKYWFARRFVETDGRTLIDLVSSTAFRAAKSAEKRALVKALFSSSNKDTPQLLEKVSGMLQTVTDDAGVSVQLKPNEALQKAKDLFFAASAVSAATSGERSTTSFNRQARDLKSRKDAANLAEQERILAEARNATQ